ncbi:glycosyltransferase 87 family protein [Rugosimonospora africana]|uniref:Alpha-1,2-mannosyltransferase n=1 Tax=Rugosimonospora africana TaxID=556532 RepID=A0A8J3QMD3_9ACTN|nr:glycosyltransferase 87 family protein [Rugosimonospora africana]GIH13695.1 hypothetical protein Raf01_18670 [Rugosimonospora africana]
MGRKVAIVVGLAAVAFAFLAVFATRHGFFDLKVYYGATNYWAHGHGEIYDYLKPLSKYGYTYPPFAALTMLPMAVLPWVATIVISVAATVVVTLVIIKWFMRPVIDRYRWTPWFTVAVVAVFAAVFEPLRETVNFGQVNMILVFLVVADLIVLVYDRPAASPGSPSRAWGGVGIGLATAIKLTPGVFILYLLLARKFRAAAVSIATTAAATIAAGLVAPHASRIFWTDAVFDTDRVGSLAYISNQSLKGFTARLNPAHPNSVVWAVLVLAALAVWGWQLRRTLRLGDDLAGLALTGAMGCLVSPVTWVHHLVWLLPAMLLLAGRALLATGRRRIRLSIFTLALYVLLSSKLVWPYDNHFTGWGMLFSNAYVLATVVLLVCLPLSETTRPAVADATLAAEGRAESDVPEPERAGSARTVGVTDLGKLDDAAADAPHRVGGGRTVGAETQTRVEPAGGGVRLQYP